MKLKDLSDQLKGRSMEEKLALLAELFQGKIIFTTSFGIEDQVITHEIFTGNIDIKIATLDTGRLFPQTYEVFARTILKYKKNINVYFPDRDEVEKMVSEKGPFSFHESVENRMECCRLRKVIPLNRALKGMECWISGIRADQSDDRSKLDWIEYDEDKKLYKFYPLLDWSFYNVNEYVKINHIPYNQLHDKGYASIGCEPCTKAIKPGENFRAGRWWWESDGPKECGLHIKG